MRGVMKPIEMLGCSVTTMVRMITKCYIGKLWFVKCKVQVFFVLFFPFTVLLGKLWFVKCKVHISFCALMTVFVFTVN